jgi:hypothetical protein
MKKRQIRIIIPHTIFIRFLFYILGSCCRWGYLTKTN